MTDFANTSIIDLAAIVASHLEQNNIEVVLVGGLAVEFYCKNIYLTRDIDMVNTSYQTPKIMRDAMAELDFSKNGRIYVNDSTEITVEFPSAPLTVGDDIIKKTTTIKVGDTEVPILYASDVVKDRLAAYFHWQDKPSLAQALTVMINHDIKPDDIKSFCVREQASEEYPFIQDLYNMSEIKNLRSMEEIEDVVLNEYLNRQF